MKEAVREFYAANAANIRENERLLEENDALRELIPEEDLADFPEPIPLDVDDIHASWPEDIMNQLPPDVQMYFRWWRQNSKPRKTERACAHLLSNIPWLPDY
jgi:hypothetical protein